MIYLGIAFVVLLIVAPIIALLPSAQQREQMALRRRAMSAGVRTELTTIDDPNPEAERYITVTGKRLEQKLKCIAYRLPRERPWNWRDLQPMKWSMSRGPDGWQSDEALPESTSDELRAAVDEALETLPDDAIRVDEEHYVVSVYWCEKGGDGALDAIIESLKKLSAVVAHAPPPEGDDDLEE